MRAMAKYTCVYLGICLQCNALFKVPVFLIMGWKVCIFV